MLNRGYLSTNFAQKYSTLGSRISCPNSFLYVQLNALYDARDSIAEEDKFPLKDIEKLEIPDSGVTIGPTRDEQISGLQNNEIIDPDIGTEYIKDDNDKSNLALEDIAETEPEIDSVKGKNSLGKFNKIETFVSYKGTKDRFIAEGASEEALQTLEDAYYENGFTMKGLPVDLNIYEEEAKNLSSNNSFEADEDLINSSLNQTDQGPDQKLNDIKSDESQKRMVEQNDLQMKSSKVSDVNNSTANVVSGDSGKIKDLIDNYNPFLQ